MRSGAVRLEQDRFFEVLQRLGGRFNACSATQIVVRLGKIRIPLDDAADQAHGSRRRPAAGEGAS